MTEDQAGRLQIISQPEPVDALEAERYRLSQVPHRSLEEAAHILTMKREEQARLAYRNLRYGYLQMRQFFAEVVLGQDMSHVRPRVTGKFLREGDETSGLSILALAAKRAVESTLYRGSSVDEMYARAYEAGRLHPLMPPSAGRLVKDKLGDYPVRMKLLPRLRNSLLGLTDVGIAS